MSKKVFEFNAQHYQELLSELEKLADPTYKTFSQKLIPGSEEHIIGVRTPIVKKLTKRLLSEYDPASMIDFFYDAQFYTGSLEERSILGSVLAHVPYEDSAAAFAAVDRYLPYIDNWATCDTFSGKLDFIYKQWPDKLWLKVNEFLKSSNPWEIRLGLVMIIEYFCKSELVDEIFKMISPIDSDHYYLNMGLAWMLSMLYLENKEKVLQLMQETIANDWVFNKSIQKIRESRQVDKKEKDYLNTLKRKTPNKRSKK